MHKTSQWGNRLLFSPHWQHQIKLKSKTTHSAITCSVDTPYSHWASTKKNVKFTIVCYTTSAQPKDQLLVNDSISQFKSQQETLFVWDFETKVVWRDASCDSWTSWSSRNTPGEWCANCCHCVDVWPAVKDLKTQLKYLSDGRINAVICLWCKIHSDQPLGNHQVNDFLLSLVNQTPFIH